MLFNRLLAAPGCQVTRRCIIIGLLMTAAIVLTPRLCHASDAAEAVAHPFGFWSLAPPLLAIVLAIVTRRIIASLLAAVFVGALILAHGDFFAAAVDTCETRLWLMLVDTDHLRVFAFTSLMAAMVGVMQRSGGMHALVRLFTPWAHNRRRGQLATWLLGLAVFFDDYANTLLLGGTMRPVTDRLRISREKLAYIVDSTAAPVAGLALISTWVAIEVDYIAEGFAGLNIPQGEQAAFAIFVQTIPYRFYQVLALVFVALVAWLARDFGPMLRAERRAWIQTDGQDPAPGAVKDHAAMTPSPDQPQRWHHAVLPVVVVIVVAAALIVLTGNAAIKTKSAALKATSTDVKAESTAVKAESTGNQPVTFWRLVGEGDSYLALMYAALAGLAAAMLLACGQRALTFAQARAAAAAGASMVAPALVVLWMAWCLQDVTREEPVDSSSEAQQAASDLAADSGNDAASEEKKVTIYKGLHTASYLKDALGDHIPIALLPTVVFLLASATAFATGSSWATMGILTPLVIQVSHGILGAPAPDDPLMLASIGSVLAGSIFGDHCSPISDTTVLSSAASGCHHLAHVWSQMPYALTVAAVAVVCGTLPAGYGLSTAGCCACLLAGTGALAGVLFLFGRRVEEDGD